MVKNLKCLVIDDEAPARQLLQIYIEKIPGLEVVAVCESALDALNWLDKESFDMAFIDIQMPDLTGIDFLNIAGQKLKTVIFTTAYREFALKGYELGIVDYLLKPFSFERFLKAVQRAKEFLDLRMTEKPSKIELEKVENIQDASFFVKSGQKLIKIALKDLVFIEGMKEYVALNSVNGSRILTYYRMKNIEDILPVSQFIRIHRSFIINKKFVAEIDGYQVKVLDKWIPIGGNYREILAEITNNIL